MKGYNLPDNTGPNDPEAPWNQVDDEDTGLEPEEDEEPDEEEDAEEDEDDKNLYKWLR